MSISEQLIELGFAGKLQEDLSFIIEDENDFDEFLLFCSSKEKESNMRIVKDYRGIMFKKDLIDKKEFIECYKCSDIKGRHKLCEGFTKRKIRVDTIELMDYYLDLSLIHI